MRLTKSQARRIALAAQGFGGRPANPTMRQFQRVIDQLGVIQIDSVNVVARAHLLPMYSRLGNYDVGLFDRATKGAPPRLVEYWAHMAAYTTPEIWNLMEFRRDAYRQPTSFAGRLLAKNHALVDDVLVLIKEDGPLTARQVHSQLGHERGPKEHWGWNWSVAKEIMEGLFATGDLAVARRNAQFERLYDLPERILGPLPTEHLDAGDAAVELIRIAAKALGVGTARCFADYFRMKAEPTKRAIARLVADGELTPVEVDGWDAPTYLQTQARKPRQLDARALLAPFDPLVFERQRLLNLFGMHYRIGIYTPAAQREHGYYVLPFLLGQDLVGRVDIKADRKASVLRALQITWEPDAPAHAAAELEAELRVMADWLQLSDVAIS